LQTGSDSSAGCLRKSGTEFENRASLPTLIPLGFAEGQCFSLGKQIRHQQIMMVGKFTQRLAKSIRSHGINFVP
jgi:hypothetical protein